MVYFVKTIKCIIIRICYATLTLIQTTYSYSVDTRRRGIASTSIYFDKRE